MGLTKFIAENSYFINSLWVLAAVFVFLMQSGFACCESGFAITKSTCNIYDEKCCLFLCRSLGLLFYWSYVW